MHPSPTLYRSLSVALLAAFAVSCSKEKLDVAPSPRVSTANATVTFTFNQYTRLPEQLVDVAGDGGSFIDYSGGGAAKYISPFALGKSKRGAGQVIYQYTAQPSIFYAGSFSSTDGRWEVASDVPANRDNGGVTRLVTSWNPSAQHVEYWAVDAQNFLWAYTYNQTYSGAHWYWTGFYASDVTLQGSSAVYFLGVDNVNGGRKIYRYGYPNTPEVSPGFTATSIALDGNGRLWAVNSLHQLFVNEQPLNGGSFVQIPGNATQVASDGPTVAILSAGYMVNGYEIFARSTADPINSPSAWTREYGGEATRIAGVQGGYTLINALGQAYSATY